MWRHSDIYLVYGTPGKDRSPYLTVEPTYSLTITPRRDTVIVNWSYQFNIKRNRKWKVLPLIYLRNNFLCAFNLSFRLLEAKLRIMIHSTRVSTLIKYEFCLLSVLSATFFSEYSLLSDTIIFSHFILPSTFSYSTSSHLLTSC